MATKLDVCNGALVKLGMEPVLDVDSNNITDKGAKRCKLRYDVCRKFVLRAYSWPFAIKRAVLSPQANIVPAFGRDYSFLRPGDLLRVLSVLGSDDYELDYDLEGNEILADESNLHIIYIRDVDLIVYADATFVEALSAYMAWDMCISLTEKETTRNQLWEDFVKLLGLGKFVSSTERPKRYAYASYLENSRSGG